MSEARAPEPAAADEAEIALANWAAELVERLERGEPVNLTALATAHPERAEELARVLPTIRRMVSFGRAIERSLGGVRLAKRSEPEAQLGTLGDFRLLREVGRGGMGVVYEAEQVSLGRRVALKILPLAAALDPRQHQRFLLEARAAACLHHTHIVPVFAVGSERGVPYYAMQFIEGFTLAQALRDLRGFDPGRPHPHDSHATRATSASTDLSWSCAPVEGGPDRPATGSASSLGRSSRDRAYIRAVAELGRRAAEALDHAHGLGILHRDIKPANLMLDVAGHLWVTDFGLAQIQGDSRLTLTGDILGTLRYMSPEQALAKRVVIDGRTDVYSLGATLYEALALRPVFDGADRAEVLRKITQDEPAPLRRLNPAVARDLETIVHKALAKEPSERYATARELADDLRRFLDARAIAARPPGRLERFGKWARRNRAVVVPAALFASFVLIALACGLVWSNNWLSRHNERLRIERDRARELSGQLKEQRDLVEQRRQIADRHVYAFRLRQAGEALRARRFEKAQDILLDCRPASGDDDPREFAWHYLWREARREVAVLSERGETVWSLALSADGRTVAVGDQDGSIRLRDSATGEMRCHLRGHPVRIEALAFSADGSWLASGTGFEHVDQVLGRGELLLWDSVSGRLLARFHGFEHRYVDNLRFNASGEFLWELSEASRDRTEVGLWRLERRSDGVHPRLLRRWASRRRMGRGSLPVSADGRRVAADEDEGRVVVVEDAAAGRVLCRLPRESRGYDCTALSRDGRLVATAVHDAEGASGTLSVWDTETGRRVVKHRVDSIDHVVKLSFSLDERSLVARTWHGSIRHVALDRGETWRIDPDGTDPDEHSGDFFLLPGGRLLARTDWPRDPGSPRLQLYDLERGGLRAAFPGRPESADRVLGDPDGRSLVFSSQPRAVAWHLEPSVEPQPFGHDDEAWAVAFSSDCRLLATGSDDTDEPETLKVWDAATGESLRGWEAHDATTSALAFQPGGHVLASAALRPEENLRLWDARTGALLATLAGHTSDVRTIAFSPDGRLLASAGSDRTIRLWDVAGRRCLRTLEGHTDKIRRVAFAPDGRTLASCDNDGTVRLWSTDGADPVWIREGGMKVAAVTFSPDGRTLAWAHEDGVIQRWDLARGQPLAPMHSEHDELRCLAFSPDGRTLAAAGKSGSIHLWDPISGQELLSLEGRPCQVNALAFSPDGSSLAACWHDGTVRIVRAN